MKQQQQASGAQPEFAHDPAQSRYELRIDGQVAGFAAYRLQGQSVAFTHTEVQPQFEGQGLGSQLAAYALDDVKRRGFKAVPQCSFIRRYIERHEEEYGELVER